jgi:hypothetical protein
LQNEVKRCQKYEFLKINFDRNFNLHHEASLRMKYKYNQHGWLYLSHHDCYASMPHCRWCLYGDAASLVMLPFWWWWWCFFGDDDGIYDCLAMMTVQLWCILGEGASLVMMCFLVMMPHWWWCLWWWCLFCDDAKLVRMPLRPWWLLVNKASLAMMLTKAHWLSSWVLTDKFRWCHFVSSFLTSLEFRFLIANQ